jgi:hypothetical protein
MTRYVNYWLHENCKRVLKGEAIFHQFGCNYEEFESGPGNFSTAIIELPDGTVLNIPVEDIAFK